MDLERIAAVIRPRRDWEAVDLGYTMVRRWWRPVYGAWLAAVLPLWMLVLLLPSLAPGLSPGWAFLLLWWLKPIFDRVPLFVISRALFGAAPSVRHTLRALPRLWLGHLWSALFVFRLDLARSFNLPVWQLEGLRGPSRSSRAAVLGKESRYNASWLTLSCYVMEWMNLMALFGLFGLLLPETVEVDLFSRLEVYLQGEAPLWFHLLLGSLYFLATSLVAPFYTAGGFGLYLNRRVHLEGWDVELVFRRLGRRLAAEQGARSRRLGATVPMVLACLIACGSHSRLAATTVEPPQLAPQEAVAEVLSQPEFETKKTVGRWRLRHDLPKRDPGAEREAPEIFADGGLAVVARVLEIFLWGLLAAALAFFMVYLGRHGGLSWRPLKKDAPRPPKVMFGLDLRPESLPADVPTAAWRLWQSGRTSAALGLLYGGALSSLVTRDELTVKSSWTEGECLSRLRQGLTQVRAGYLERLTQAWQSSAYAHRSPPEGEFRQLALEWNRHFGAAP